jgi:SAM-dependent methyltransferase
VTRSTAPVEGPEWGARAEAWAEHWARLAEPARRAVADALALAPGTRLLDVGCGSGEFCELAAARGAEVSGIDAAQGMLAVARRRVPAADLRAGPMERLPWPDGAFDAVAAFNALQFAADFRAALAEAARVARSGGHVAICNWSRREDSQLTAVLGRLGELQPPGPATGGPPPPAVREPGVLERQCRAAGLDPVAAAEVDVPYEAPDDVTLERAIVDGAGYGAAVEHVGRDAVRAALHEAAAPFRRPDGSYRFESRFRYVVARR